MAYSWFSLTSFWDWLTGRAFTLRMLQEFLATFPGRCPICSWHRYGVIHGHARPDSTPGPHDCLEADR